MSSMEIEIPACVDRRKPFCSSLSANTTVAFRPHLRKEALISLEISFFLSALFMLLKARPLGRISDSRARPTVVSTSEVTGSNSPVSLFLFHSVRRTLILACSSVSPASRARCSSIRSANTMPSPLPLILSRVA
ncbi:hypothetical protein SDC9_203752 [bioreactor metagenome]|uniref:Uncharacterized protein n=1 Tax=bioreactor metagenome TaxID=1076179 RepID=A0A645IY12_9ZZZZ